MAYHVNPATGKVNVCRATVQACRFGSEQEHFEDKNAARAFAELKLSEEFSTLSSVSVNGGLTASRLSLASRLGVAPPERMEKLLRQRLRKAMTGAEAESHLERFGVVHAPFYVYFNGNQEITLSYDDESTVRTFTKGACSLLAHEVGRGLSRRGVVYGSWCWG